MGLLWRSAPARPTWHGDVPTSVGRYEIVGRLAMGGMAEVFAAQLRTSVGAERYVVLKRIHAHLAGDEEFVNMFIDEARIAMHLRHSNVVAVLELLHEHDRYAIAMEWVDGVDLGETIGRLREGQRIFPPEIVAFIGAEVAKGLHHAHQCEGEDGQPLGIVHRDVTPANVMLSFEGEVKIADFGIARARSRLSVTRPGVVKGKLAYIPPEVYAGERPDARSDVYALGVVLYELLTGVNPFQGANSAQVIYRVRKGEVTPPRDVAPVYAPLERLTMQAMALRPEDRPQSAGALALALGDLMAGLARDRGAFMKPTGLADRLRMAFPERGLPRLGRPAVPSQIPTDDFSAEHLRRVGRASIIS